MNQIVTSFIVLLIVVAIVGIMGYFISRDLKTMKDREETQAKERAAKLELRVKELLTRIMKDREETQAKERAAKLDLRVVTEKEMVTSDGSIVVVEKLQEIRTTEAPRRIQL